MRYPRRMAAFAMALALIAPTAALAQLGGMQIPGASSLLSKDALLAQAKSLLADLTSMKSSGALQPPQAKQVDELLPRATALTGELEKPQVEASRLPGMAKDLNDMQQQVGALKSLMR